MTASKLTLEQALPYHKCALYLSHNEHLGDYYTAAEWIADWEGRECPPNWRDESQKARAIETNEVWTLHWYPDTPIGSWHICAPTLPELLEYAKEIESGE